MNDLISRQAVEEAIEFFLVDPGDGWNDIANERNRVLEYVSDKIMRMPPAQQWIPASNPPKESGFYLVTIRRLYGIGEPVIIKWFDQELNLWSTDDNLYIPTAWMPLPEPYKEVKND